jgi:hypothetical protein
MIELQGAGLALVCDAGLIQETGTILADVGAAVDVTGNFEMIGGTATLDGAVAVTNNYQQTGGTAWLGADAVTIAGQALVSGGTLNLHGPVTVAMGMEILLGGTLQITTDGAVNGNVINKGIISIGDLTGGQTFLISGNFTQTSSGKLRLQLGDASDYVGISGHANLAGTLDIAFEDGYTPSIGSYSPISWGSFEGEFVLLLPSLPEPYFWIDYYDALGLYLFIEEEY